MITLPDELLLEVIRCATEVAGELDSNLDDTFRVPSQINMEAMLKATMSTRRALVQVSRRLWNLATPALYRSIIVSHSHTINHLFVSIMRSGERSLVFRHNVWRFHLSILYDHRRHWSDVAPGAEELMEYLPNIKIFCGMGWLHPAKPLRFTPLDPATCFPHLEAIECSRIHYNLTSRESVSNLLYSSPNLRVFLVTYPPNSEPNHDLYAFKHLRGCYLDALMMNSSPSQSDIHGPSLEDTNKQPQSSSQTPFPRLRSLHFRGFRGPRRDIDRNLAHHITLLDLASCGWEGENILDLSQFPKLRTLVIPSCLIWCRFKVSDKNDKLDEIGVRLGLRMSAMVVVSDPQELVELVMGLQVRIKSLRLVEFDLCRAIMALGIQQSTILTWKTQLEEQGICLEGPSGLRLVEFLGSFSR